MTIFPVEYHSTPHVENMVISFLDLDSRLNLMLVNKAAHSILNNEHFQRLFNGDYPQLAGSPHLFLNQRYFHHEICWKVACYALAHPEFFPRNACFYRNPLVVLPGFKEMLEKREREIDGSGPKDGDSPLSRAERALKEAKNRRDAKEQAGAPLLEVEKERQESDRCLAVFLSLEEEKSTGSRFLSQIERHAKHFEEGGNEVLQLKWKLWHHDALVKELLFARNALRIDELPKLEESSLCVDRIKHLATFHPGDPGLARAVQEMTGLLQSFPTGARIMLQYRALNVGGVGIWDELITLITAEKEALKSARSALSATFTPNYLNHPAQLSPGITHFADDEGFAQWRQRMLDCVIQLLPPSYLNSPGCDLDVVRASVGAGRETMGSDEINMLADHVRNVIAPNQEEAEL